jgi:hypothetical protein
MADATVLNTVGLRPCGFESRLRHMGICREFLLLGPVDEAGLCGSKGPVVTSW